ncbi:MAG: helix-turn-helix domain-containing protein, partial [Chloroflexi bacterium]|nr:helix-turn-helix domain-containing protein [Chloroflexota bacterium]
YLQLGRDKTYQMLKSGELPCARIGRTYRIQRRALDDWLARRAAESLTS